MFIDPIIYFFLCGIALKLIWSRIRLPKIAYEVISLYLLISIGLKGGIALRTWCCWRLIYQSCQIVGLAIACTFMAYFLLKYIVRYSKNDSIVVAAHYGSVSIGTFAVALKILQSKNIYFEPYIPLFVALMEFPAIIVANILLNKSEKNSRGIFGMIYNAINHKSLYILFGSIIGGVIASEWAIGILSPIFFDSMRPILAIFLMEMGISVGEQFSTIKRRLQLILVCAVSITISCALLGMLFGIFMQLSPGGVVLLMVLAGSASYIAVPACLRTSYPGSNIALALSYSLGVTFPFNVLIGIYLYIYLVQLYFGI
ncbi:MAG: sodium-dependent bicarbonate transport family permease [Candidatus Babeliales bacterium]